MQSCVHYIIFVYKVMKPSFSILGRCSTQRYSPQQDFQNQAIRCWGTCRACTMTG